MIIKLLTCPVILEVLLKELSYYAIIINNFAVKKITVNKFYINFVIYYFKKNFLQPSGG